MFRAHASSAAALLLVLVPLLAARQASAGIDRFTLYGPWNGQIVAYVIDPSAPQSLLAITDFYGLYRSDDGGATWAFSGAGLDQDTEQGIAADPANPGSFYLVTSTEVFHSVDSGRSWTRIAAGLNFRAPIFPHGRALPVLRILPAGRGALPTLLVATTQGLYRSGDGGVTWSLVYTLDFLVLSWGPVPDPTDPRRLWLTPPDATGGRLLTSTDGGLTFTPVPNTPEPLVVTLVVPTSPVTIFATGLNDLWKSTDNGASWRKIPQPVLPMAYEPGTPSIVYATAATGFFSSSDAGETWTPRGAGLPAAGIALVQAAPGTRTLYGISILDVFRSVDRGRHWALVAESGAGEGFPTRLRFRPGAPSTVYAVRGGEGYQSRNGGAAWASFGNLAPTSEPFRGAPIRDLVIDPANPDLLYAATDKGIFDSADGGDSWSATSPQVFSSLAPAGRRRVLLGGACSLERSRDGGRTWSVTLPCPAGNPEVTRRIDRLIVDPRDPDIVYAAASTSTARSRSPLHGSGRAPTPAPAGSGSSPTARFSLSIPAGPDGSTRSVPPASSGATTPDARSARFRASPRAARASPRPISSSIR